MMNSSLGDLDAAENYYGYPSASDSSGNAEEFTLSPVAMILWIVITFTICCIGLVGNGCTIWLLGFQIKRNCFTTFILNLAISDFGYLMFIVIYFIDKFTNFQGSEIVESLYIGFILVMYINAHFLMTAISIDRCVAVLFPIWHRCSRPKHLSPAVCASLWICSVLLVGMMVIVKLTKIPLYHNVPDLLFLVSAFICLLLITLSTGVLFVKVCIKSNQRNQGQVLLTILITFLCFLILGFPLCVCAMISTFYKLPKDHIVYWATFSVLLSSLNSSINPVVYFLVGWKRGSQSKKTMKVILQNAFKESEAT